MKLNQKVFWISVIISILTLLGSIYLNFFSLGNNITNYINGILQNIFAGAIVLVITSLYEYKVAKIELLEEIMTYCIKLRSKFSEIEYLNEDKFPTLEEYKEFYKDENDIEKNYNYEKEIYEKTKKEKFEEIIDTYIEIAETDYNDFWKCYANLEFLWDRGKKKKLKIYNNLFYYIYDEKINNIREVTFHFKEYKKAKNGNYNVNKMKLFEVQKEIFHYEEHPFNKDTQASNEGKKDYIVSSEVNCISKTYSIVINEVTKNLTEMYNYISQLAYGKNIKGE